MIKTHDLTERQRSVFEFLKEKICDRGYGPTVREICDEFGIKSPNGVVCHLKALEKKGLIIRTANKSRAIELVGGHEPNFKAQLPLKGRVGADSSPTINDEVNRRQKTDSRVNRSKDSKQQIEFNNLFGRDGRFVLRIDGDELAESNVVDGDFVIVTPCQEAGNGEIVLAKGRDGRMRLLVMPDKMSSQATATSHQQWPTDVASAPANLVSAPTNVSSDSASVKHQAFAEMLSLQNQSPNRDQATFSRTNQASEHSTNPAAKKSEPRPPAQVVGRVLGVIRDFTRKS